MKTDPRRFAPLGLVLSGLAVITFIVFLVVKSIASAGIFQPPDPTVLERGLWVSLSIFFLAWLSLPFLTLIVRANFSLGARFNMGATP